jgi:hypothetical protein
MKPVEALERLEQFGTDDLWSCDRNMAGVGVNERG